MPIDLAYLETQSAPLQGHCIVTLSSSGRNEFAPKSYSMTGKDSVLAVVANYGFSREADLLKEAFSRYFSTIIIDNSSPEPPLAADVILPNTYYSGLWNAAVSSAIEADKHWLLFIASDVQVPDVDRVARMISEVCSDRYVGLYTPSLRSDSRLAYPSCFSKGTPTLRECFVCEGFFFMVRTKIVSRVFPVDQSKNIYGWGIDAFTAYTTYQMGYCTVVDDRVQIYHPAAIHEISLEEAERQVAKYLTPATVQFLRWSESQLEKRQDDGTEPSSLARRLVHWQWRTREWLRDQKAGRAPV